MKIFSNWFKKTEASIKQEQEGKISKKEITKILDEIKKDTFHLGTGRAASFPGDSYRTLPTHETSTHWRILSFPKGGGEYYYLKNKEAARCLLKGGTMTIFKEGKTSEREPGSNEWSTSYHFIYSKYITSPKELVQFYKNDYTQH